jgi:hypothetical protein
MKSKFRFRKIKISSFEIGVPFKIFKHIESKKYSTRKSRESKEFKIFNQI